MISWTNPIAQPADRTMTSTPAKQNPVDLLQSLSIEGPVDVFNQLKFRDRAEYPDGSGHPACSGREAFRRYSDGLPPVLAKIGGSIKIWRGRVHAELSPGNAETWDLMLVFQFPSIDALIRLFEDPDFQAVHVHREAAIAQARTFVCTGD
jgi:uncharacterized protein (DUF1330 family)